MNLENTCYSNQGSVSRAGEQAETSDEPRITSKVQSVFIVAYKRSDIYRSMHCQGLGMTPMLIFHVKKMFLKVVRQRCHAVIT